jgi:hypothetical protein
MQVVLVKLSERLVLSLILPSRRKNQNFLGNIPVFNPVRSQPPESVCGEKIKGIIS